MHLHHRRRSQHNRRPPPAPVRLVLISRRFHPDMQSGRVHAPGVGHVTATAERLASRLFCGFDRWAAAVHRPVPPTNFPQAAKQLGALRWPREPLSLEVDFDQSNPYSLGPGLGLNTSNLRQCELDDLRWLAQADTAWHRGRAPTARKRRGFVCNAILRRAHDNMLKRDGNRWGGLVPRQLVAMVRHHEQPYHARPQQQLSTTLSRQETA